MDSQYDVSNRKQKAASLALEIVGQKRCYFEKQTGEVVENKASDYICSRKRTGNKPENEAEKLLKTCACGKNEPETKRKSHPPVRTHLSGLD